MKQLLKSIRVILLIVCVSFSLLFISNVIKVNKTEGVGFGNGLDYGLDFVGGTELQLQLDRPVDRDVMAVEKGILENRLNSLGLKDIPVRPWGNQYILIQVAGATPNETQSIEDILKQQARFEERIDGELSVLGEEIQVDLGPGGTQIAQTPAGFSWSVVVSHDREGACRFGEVGDGKRGRPVDIYVDRPNESIILMTAGTYGILENVTSADPTEDYLYGDTLLEVIENRSRIPVIAVEGENETGFNTTLDKLEEYKERGFNTVVLAAEEDRLSYILRNQIEELGFNTKRNPKGDERSYANWIKELTGLKSSPRLNFETQGECIYSAQITGSALTLEEAQEAVKTNQVLLTSGNLPAKATVESKATTPPTLGVKFLRYSFYTGILAILTVAIVVYIRYRQFFIVGSIMVAALSEIIIILGLAALINWNLDLPAIAGIIAAVGTGVDHQIVITDETLRERKRTAKLISVSERIRRAFFIIFTAAATTIAAMFPLLSIGAGMLKGFAFTTIMGVLVGISITRPAYARIIEEFVRKKE
ncbi:hypothetical protein ACFLRC_03440 [Candidatus Altiarchaeota archaeon]